MNINRLIFWKKTKSGMELQEGTGHLFTGSGFYYEIIAKKIKPRDRN